MCGIWISVGFEPEQARIDMVSHRGPDGSGWREFDTDAGRLCLGHRRLAIIDTSDAALQPMSYTEGRFWLVFNGEIYNFIELRRELEARGHVFRTRSDSEVILAGYLEWGEEIVSRLIGMFAFAVLDLAEQILFVARDAFGVKPLYVFSSASGLALASEIKQLRGLPGESGRMNLPRVYDFLVSGIMDHTEETLFHGIGQLRGGESFTIRLDRWRAGAPLQRHRWYRLPEPGSLVISEAEAGERFLALLQDSVRLHLRSDVPVGSCLSGGLDSSAIVCLMRRSLDAQGVVGTLNTFSACFDEAEVDERPYMRAVVEATGANAHFVFPRPEAAFELAERLTWHQDEPYGSTSIYAQWSVFERAAGEGVKVMLDGQGADEQLAGYHGSFGYYYRSLLRERRYPALLRAMLERRRFHGVPVLPEVRSYLGHLLPSWLRTPMRSAVGGPVPLAWWNSSAWRATDPPASVFDAAAARDGYEGIEDIGTLCAVLTGTTNLAMLLHWEDRSSMAHGVEARVPFLDRRLVEFDIALGSQHKIVGGDTKRVLRRGLRGILPEGVRQRRDKLGFTTPEMTWFRGPLRRLVAEGVEASLARYPDLLDADATRRHVSEMLEGLRPVDFSLWRIVNLGIWGRVFQMGM